MVRDGNMLANRIINTLNPLEEVLAYETLWAIDGMTEAKMTDLFKKTDDLPSKVLGHLFQPSLLNDNPVDILKKKVADYISTKLGSFSVCLYRDFQYPDGLRKAKHPIEMFYYRGNLDLLDTPSLSIVGAREVSEEGYKRAIRLSKELSSEGFTIVSGLAKGVDTAAHTTALSEGKNTIGVIGTPIDEFYPKENKDLQSKIATEQLLISQVPFYRYKHESFPSHKIYFPRRNATMAAISKGTIIVEASDTSGSLTQARACIQQGKKLFILESCFKNKNISWPEHYLKLGAIRVRSTDDILKVLIEVKV